jgi:hypothetical protein
VLPHRLWESFARELLYICGNDHRLYLLEASAALLTPIEELSYRSSIGKSRVRVPDIGGEEFEEAFRGPLLFSGDDVRENEKAGSLFLDRQLLVHWVTFLSGAVCDFALYLARRILVIKEMEFMIA